VVVSSFKAGIRCDFIAKYNYELDMKMELAARGRDRGWLPKIVVARDGTKTWLTTMGQRWAKNRQTIGRKMANYGPKN
jgi:hypothetical protein